jgi:hypothetical protein
VQAVAQQLQLFWQLTVGGDVYRRNVFLGSQSLSNPANFLPISCQFFQNSAKKDVVACLYLNEFVALSV